MNTPADEPDCCRTPHGVTVYVGDKVTATGKETWASRDGPVVPREKAFLGEVFKIVVSGAAGRKGWPSLILRSADRSGVAYCFPVLSLSGLEVAARGPAWRRLHEPQGPI